MALKQKRKIGLATRLMLLMKIVLFCLLFLNFFVSAQTKNILFLGNSYTAVNNLPQMFADVAGSAGHTAITDFNAPGGYTLQGHSTNATSLSKITSGGWDFVVLQEQSQHPLLI